jgi:hypothetical protein
LHIKELIQLTFLVGECITGAGGEGGPRGIFLLILKHNQILSACCFNPPASPLCDKNYQANLTVVLLDMNKTSLILKKWLMEQKMNT